MATDKLLILLIALFASAFAAKYSHDVFQFFADYFAGAATIAALEYISED